MLGWHTERYKYLPDWMYRKNFPNNELTDLNAGDASTQQNAGNTRELSMVSYFGRLNYDYAGRYLFEANFRSDASSRFAELIAGVSSHHSLLHGVSLRNHSWRVQSHG